MRASHENQQKILDFIKAEIEEKGYPPSVREICAAVGLRSTSTVHAHLNHLEAQGLIRRDSTKPRALEVLDGSQARGRSVPLVGRVTAGQPILAIENIEEYLTLPQSVLGQGKMFSLKVEGESMIDAGILDGDIVVLRQQDTAENGDIVVAMTPRTRPPSSASTMKKTGCASSRKTPRWPRSTWTASPCWASWWR